MESHALDDYIQANYKTQSINEIALACGVSRATVCRHARSLGCTKYKVKSNRQIKKVQKVRLTIIGNRTIHNLI